MLQDVNMKRDIATGSYPFMEIFTGFEVLEVVRSLFGEKTSEILAEIRVDVQARPGYLRVDDETGHIWVSRDYLRTGEQRHLYLDVIHELVHIRQFLDGKELFDRKYSYVDRPTEIEAYQVCVGEGKRLGMKEDEVVEYLKVEWITEHEFARLLSSVGVKSKIRSQSEK
jgi:hypothetical protein